MVVLYVVIVLSVLGLLYLVTCFVARLLICYGVPANGRRFVKQNRYAARNQPFKFLGHNTPDQLFPMREQNKKRKPRRVQKRSLRDFDDRTVNEVVPEWQTATPDNSDMFGCSNRRAWDDLMTRGHSLRDVIRPKHHRFEMDTDRSTPQTHPMHFDRKIQDQIIRPSRLFGSTRSAYKRESRSNTNSDEFQFSATKIPKPEVKTQNPKSVHPIFPHLFSVPQEELTRIFCTGLINDDVLDRCKSTKRDNVNVPKASNPEAEAPDSKTQRVCECGAPDVDPEQIQELKYDPRTQSWSVQKPCPKPAPDTSDKESSDQKSSKNISEPEKKESVPPPPKCSASVNGYARVGPNYRPTGIKAITPTRSYLTYA